MLLILLCRRQVDLATLEEQARARREAAAAQAAAAAQDEARQLAWARQVERLHAQAEVSRRSNAHTVAEQLRRQAEDKRCREEEEQRWRAEQRLGDDYFRQFGTSHR